MLYIILIISLTTKCTTCQISGVAFDACENCPQVTRTKLSTVANSVFENTTYAVIANHKPSWDFGCRANYPVEWLLHFHENDNPESQQIDILVFRDVGTIQDPSTYSYRTNLKIDYAQRIRFFPNYTCQAVHNSSLLTRLILFGDDNVVNLSVVSTSNDHHIVSPTSSACKTQLFFSLRSGPGPGWEHGPCYHCLDASVKLEDWWSSRHENPILKAYFNCENLFHCRSLYQHVQNKLSCLRVHIPEANDSNGTRWPVEVQRTPSDVACSTESSFKPFIVYCKPLSGPVDVAQIGFYGVRQASGPSTGNRPVPYIRWYDAKPEDMIETVINVEDKSIPLYELQNVSVTCRVSQYYCAYFARLRLQWNEGQIEYLGLEDTFELWKVWGERSNHAKGYYEQHFNLTLTTYGNLTLHCLGPVINSSEWISDQVTVQVRQIQIPKIILLDYSSPVEGTKLKTGAKDNSLTCSFEGEPITAVEWKFNNESILPVGTRMSINAGSSVLSLPDVFLQLAGSYTCRVETFFGYSEETFVVDVEEILTSSSFLWITISTVLVILLAVCGEKSCRYSQAYVHKELSRTLSSLQETLLSYWFAYESQTEMFGVVNLFRKISS